MKLYHGTIKNFDNFDLEFYKTGETGSLTAKGIYLSEDIAVADFYRNKIKGGDLDHVSYHIGDLEIDDEKELEAFHAILEDDISDSDFYFYEDDEDFDKELLSTIKKLFDYYEITDSSSFTETRGLVYEVFLPDSTKLLDWESDIDSQPIDYYDLSLKLIGEDKLDNKIEELASSCLSWDQDEMTFGEDIERLLKSNFDPYIIEELNETYPELNINELQGFIQNEWLFLDGINESGKAIYEHVVGIKGEDEAIEFFKENGISGAKMGNRGNSVETTKQNFVIWDTKDLKIKEKYNLDSDIEMKISDNLSNDKSNKFNFDINF